MLKTVKRKFEVMKYDCLDAVSQHTDALLSAASEWKNDHYELPSPIMFELTNPMARFSCMAENRGQTAKSAAETLYAFSGMNSNDFIWEFRDWEDPRVIKLHDRTAVGSQVRFFDSDDLLDYRGSTNLRQKGVGFIDQLSDVITILKRNRNAENIILQTAAWHNSIPVYYSWLYCRDDTLNIMTQAGRLNNHTELLFKYLPIFSFMLQIISELTGIPMGSVRFVVGCLCTQKLCATKNIRSINYPVINAGDFRYPSGGLVLRDLDVLMAIMIEFVSRLDGSSINRANPFEGDARVQMWSDYAEIFRAWKAEKLGCTIEKEQNFFHPQLRFLYKGEAV
jgi:hypothetical protein